jgi:hypothetical protein
VADCLLLALLLLCHRWLEGLPWFHRGRRPPGEQDVHDQSRRGEYAVTPLLSPTASQDLVLLQIGRNAEAFAAVAPPLSEVLDNTRTHLIHPSIQQRPKIKQQDGQDILVYGSATLVQTLIQHDLVDRSQE